MSKFKKNQENFTCEHCGHEVKGDGYTNHCSKCLWSKHVDVNPGDRAATCLGMMEPVSILNKGNEYVLTNQCLKCGHQKPNILKADDSFDEAVKIVSKI